MKLQEDNYLKTLIQERIKKNQNNVIAIIGETGSGKSMASLTLGAILDKDFSAKRVCFSILELIKQINSGLPRGSVIILDDAGMSVGSRMWQDKIVQLFGLLTQSFRSKFLTLIITVPKLNFIEAQSRSLISLLFQHKGSQGVFLVKIPYVKSNISSKEETTYYVYPYIGKHKRLKHVYFSLPNKELIEDYEYIKALHMEKFYSEFEEELTNTEKRKKYEKKGYNPNSLKNLKNQNKQSDNSDMYR